MCHTKFQPNILTVLEKKNDFNGFDIFSYNGHLGISTRLNFIILQPCSLVMLQVKF